MNDFFADCHPAQEIHAAGATREPGACLPATGEKCQVPGRAGIFKGMSLPCCPSDSQHFFQKLKSSPM